MNRGPTGELRCAWATTLAGMDYTDKRTAPVLNLDGWIAGVHSKTSWRTWHNTVWVIQTLEDRTKHMSRWHVYVPVSPSATHAMTSPALSSERQPRSKRLPGPTRPRPHSSSDASEPLHPTAVSATSGNRTGPPAARHPLLQAPSS